MALDPSRAQLVSAPFRYETVEDAAIKSQFPTAREIIMETSLDKASATALANSTFAMTRNDARTYEVVVRDRLLSKDFLGGAPRYTVDFGSRHPAALATGLDVSGTTFTGFIVIDQEGTWEFGLAAGGTSLKIDDDTTTPVYLAAGLHSIVVTTTGIPSPPVTYRSPAMITAGTAAATVPATMFRHALNPTYTVIGATTRLRAGTTTLTVRA